MQDGTFIYPRWDDGAPQHLRVRECPDPAKTRALIESLTGPTRWEPKR